MCSRAMLCRRATVHAGCVPSPAAYSPRGHAPLTRPASRRLPPACSPPSISSSSTRGSAHRRTRRCSGASATVRARPGAGGPPSDSRPHRLTLARMRRCRVLARGQRGPLLPTAGVAITAYGSLGSSSNKASVGSGVAQVAARHGVSPAALLLRWAFARGVAVIPGASSAAHIRENLAAQRLRFELSPEDEAIIAGDAKPPGWKLWPNMGKG